MSNARKTETKEIFYLKINLFAMGRRYILRAGGISKINPK